MQCQNNLKQIALGLHNYHDTYKHLPPGTVYSPDLPPEKRLSWMSGILPFAEQASLYEKLNHERAWDAEENRAAGTTINVYRCPTRTAPPSHTHYVGLAGIGPDAELLMLKDPRAGVFGYERQLRLVDITDGPSFTAMLIETTRENGPWAAGGAATVRDLDPAETAYVGDGRPFGSKHKSDTFFRTNPVVANTAFADGSVRTLHASVAPDVLRALVTIAGGERVAIPGP